MSLRPVKGMRVGTRDYKKNDGGGDEAEGTTEPTDDPPAWFVKLLRNRPELWGGPTPKETERFPLLCDSDYCPHLVSAHFTKLTWSRNSLGGQEAECQVLEPERPRDHLVPPHVIGQETEAQRQKKSVQGHSREAETELS